MKTNLGFIFIIAVAGGLLGFGVERILASRERMGGASVAGQTLSDLSRALEIEKERSGAYPEFLDGLQVLSHSAEFSQDVLRRVVYRKTADGYVAFVGSPDVVYIEPGKSAQFK